MKINEFNRVGSVNPYRKTNETTPGSMVKNRQSMKDQVQISSQAKELLKAQASHDPERAERIAELKKAVQEGTYHVPSGLIAEKLLRYLTDEPE